MNIETHNKKLTDWKNEPTLNALKRDLKASISSHNEQVTKIKHWQDLLFVANKEKPPVIKGRSQVQPKLIRRQAEWRYSALTEPFLGSDRIFRVSPRTFEDSEAARQNQLLLNYQFDTKINKVKFIDEFVRATVNEGTSIIRVGWERESEIVQEIVPEYAFYPAQDEQYVQQLQQAMQLKQTNIRGFNEQVPEELKQAVYFTEETGQPVMAIPVGQTIVENEHIIENKPTIELVNPVNVYIDPSCQGDIDKAMFVIVSFEPNRAELAKSGVYTNLDKVDWSAGTNNDPDHESLTPDDFTFDEADGFRKRIVAYEYWGYYDINKTGKLVPIVATWIGDTLIRMAENPYPDQKLPFVFVPYMPCIRSVYGEPDAELLSENQKVLGAVTRGMIDLMGKSANSQQGFAKGALDPVNKRRFESGQDYEFNASNGGIQASYIMHTYPEIPNSAMDMLTLMNQEAEALTGVKSFSGGISGEAYGQVAAGIQGVLDASSKREMAILRRLAKGLSDIGNKIIAMNAEFLNEEEVVRITNKEFVTIRREDIQGNFDLMVDISTAEIDNAKAQDMGFMLQTIGPNIDPLITTMIMADIADLKRMPELAERLRQWRPQPDPLEEQKKQLEIAKLQAEVELAQARGNKYEAEAEATQVDTQQEIDGTKHQRDLEKQKAQADANSDLQIIKGLTAPRKYDQKAPNIEAAVGYNLSKNALKDAANAQLNPAPAVPDNVTHRLPNERERFNQTNNQLAENVPQDQLGYVPPYMAR